MVLEWYKIKKLGIYLINECSCNFIKLLFNRHHFQSKIMLTEKKVIKKKNCIRAMTEIYYEHEVATLNIAHLYVDFLHIKYNFAQLF